MGPSLRPVEARRGRFKIKLRIYTGPGRYEIRGVNGLPEVWFVDPAPPEVQKLDERTWFKVSRDEEARSGRGSYMMPDSSLADILLRKIEEQ